MATTVNGAFEEFMKDKVNLAPEDTKNGPSIKLNSVRALFSNPPFTIHHFIQKMFTLRTYLCLPTDI